MKKICAMFIIFTIMNCILPFTARCMDRTISANEAVNILIPYEDDHVMTRKECMTAINRMIGISDKTVLAHTSWHFFDYPVKYDIEFSTYYGRFVDLGLHNYDRIIPSQMDNYFKGEEFVKLNDVLLWMVNCIATRSDIPKEDILKNALELGLIQDNEVLLLGKNILAKDFKIYSERFLECTVGIYFDNYDGTDIDRFTKLNNTKFNGYDGKDEKFYYIDVFNDTYKDKVIKILGDDIYLGKNKLDNSNNSFFIDENGVMMMSVRSLAEIFDFDQEIIWDESTQTVNLKNNVELNMFFEVNSDVCSFAPNEVEFSFGIPARIINDTMYIPMRTVCEGLTYDVIWCN